MSGNSDFRADEAVVIREIIAGLWRDLLEADRPIESDDDFFDLGGHSLLVMRMIADVADRIGVECTFRELVDNATFEAFTGVVIERAADLGDHWIAPGRLATGPAGPATGAAADGAAADGAADGDDLRGRAGRAARARGRRVHLDRSPGLPDRER